MSRSSATKRRHQAQDTAGDAALHERESWTSRLARPESNLQLDDELTGLEGLLSLRALLEQLVRVSPPSGARPALVLVDLDGFRSVDASYGRDVGDAVLAEIGSRLKSMVSTRGSAYRTGDDEFAVVLSSTTPFEAADSARMLLRALSAPLEVGGFSVNATASAAVVMLGSRTRADGLFRDADVTMYRAKVEGGNRVDIYNWELDSWAVARKRDVERLNREVEELRLQNRVMSQAMTIDPQTGLPNGQAFDADQIQLHARRSRSNEPYSVLLACIDHIDEANERLLLPGGDLVVKTVGATIKETIRLSDRAYRLGENQFAVLLQGTDLRQAISAGERIRSKIEQLGIGYPDDPMKRLTVTVCVIEAGFRHQNTKDVFAEVSVLMQQSSDGSGNRIVWPR